VAAVRAAVTALKWPVKAIAPLGLRPAHDAIRVGLAVERNLAAAAAGLPSARSAGWARRAVDPASLPPAASHEGPAAEDDHYGDDDQDDRVSRTHATKFACRLA
jgi:hypothetical protein